MKSLRSAGSGLFVSARRGARFAAAVGWALIHKDHPLIVHLIPMRRCNLACAYCNEYDATSSPVALAEVVRRVDRLAALGTSVVTLSGGEPMLHPELDAVIRAIRKRGMFATLITNGYLLSRERIRALNAAGLDQLQISIDNVEPDEVSKKSLRLLEPKLRWLAEEARFAVNINSVVGGGIKRPADAVTITRRARELGFSCTVGILHDGRGQLRGLSPDELAVYRELKTVRGLTIGRINDLWQENLVAGKPNDWRCRAGARYLYVDEFGLVHYCSQQRGAPGIPLERYTRADIRREHWTPKACSPFCTVNCAQQASLVDRWRDPQIS
jgi:MoaA/NifB/PqqE/SkfB family radical SAM enzyme